jgi:predicted PurR-regulated permease PerM
MVRYAPRAECRALAVLALAAVAAVSMVALPLAGGLVLGALVAVALQPLYRSLLRHVDSAVLAAIACCAVASSALVVALGTVVFLLVVEGGRMAKDLPGALGAHGPVQQFVDGLARRVAPLGISSHDLVDRARQAAEALAGESGRIAAAGTSFVADALLGVVFMVLTMYTILRHGPALARFLVDLSPLRPRFTRHLLGKLRETARSVFLGTLVVGIAQGLLAGVGYAVSGVPAAGVFGALTAVASVLPGFGTLLVWVPAGVSLLATGHAVGGAAELAWGTFVVVAACDGVLRPKLVGRGADLPFVPTMIGIFGGLALFGALGFLLGPLLVGFGISILHLYRRCRRAGQPVAA